MTEVANPLALLEQPFAFTQYDLLDVNELIDKAHEWDMRAREADLRMLLKAQLVVPLYRISSDGDPAKKIAVADQRGGLNTRGDLLLAALDGRVHDPAQENVSDDWTFAIEHRTRDADWKLLNRPGIRGCS